MRKYKKAAAWILAGSLCLNLCACSIDKKEDNTTSSTEVETTTEG